MGGLSMFTWIPEKPFTVTNEVWNLFCHCFGSSKEFRGWGYDEEHNWWYHVGCGKPRPHFGILFECDGCEDWFRSNRLPERTLLCEGCVAAND